VIDSASPQRLRRHRQGRWPRRNLIGGFAGGFVHGVIHWRQSVDRRRAAALANLSFSWLALAGVNQWALAFAISAENSPAPSAP